MGVDDEVLAQSHGGKDGRSCLCSEEDVTQQLGIEAIPLLGRVLSRVKIGLPAKSPCRRSAAIGLEKVLRRVFKEEPIGAIIRSQTEHLDPDVLPIHYYRRVRDVLELAFGFRRKEFAVKGTKAEDLGKSARKSSVRRMFSKSVTEPQTDGCQTAALYPVLPRKGCDYELLRDDTKARRFDSFPVIREQPPF